MLTIAKGTNDADIYFSKDNYYTKEEGLEQSQWRGRGAQRLNLTGQVDPDVFKALLDGEVEDQKLGRFVKGQRQHRSGWDLTFSAPKSLSILSEVYGVSLVRSIHEQAVSEAIQAAEGLIDARLMVDGKSRVLATNNGVFATFTHDVNRNLDCQLHTHCYLLNLTCTERGWRSIRNDRLMTSQREKHLGLVYRLALAKGLKAAGYELTTHRDPSLFEIKGVPQGLIDEFSTRSKEIEAWFETHKIPYTPVMAKTVALMSRQSKKAVARDKLTPLWQERAAPYQFDPQGLLPTARHRDGPLPRADAAQQQARPEPTREIRQAARKALKHALKHLSERDMGFTLKELRVEALRFGLGELDYEDIMREVVHLQRRGGIVRSREHLDVGKREEQYWTTPAMKAIEASLIQAVADNKHIGKGMVKADYAEKRLAKTILNAKQRGAIQAALTSKDRFFAIQGDPGVGKTTALREYKKILVKKGYEVLAMAPNYQAVGELADSLSIQGITVDRYLADPTSKKMGRAFRPQVWIVDEASMLSADRVIELMALAKERNARIIFVGDHQQLESVGIGRGFKHLLDAGMQASVLNEWVRPKTALAKEAFKRVMAQDYGGTVNLLHEAGGVRQIAEESIAIEKLANEWLQLSPEEREKTQVIAPTNEQCASINECVRQGLQAEKAIGQANHVYRNFNTKHMTGEEVRFAGAYQVGDVVRVNQEHLAVGKKKACIMRHEYFSVHGVNRETNTLALKSTKTKRVIYVNPSDIRDTDKGGISVFTEQEINVSRGDKLRWLDNKNTLGLKNNTGLTVQRLGDKWMRVQKEDGTSIKLPLNDLKNMHFAHAYAKTAYGVQGATKKNVMALMNSWRLNTTNGRSFMVAITRATHNITLYTDSARALIKGLSERSGNNTEALTTPEFARSIQVAAIPSDTVQKPSHSRLI